MRRPLLVLLACVALAAPVLGGCARVPPDTRPVPSPTVAQTDPPAVPTQPELVYFPRTSNNGVRLGREVHEVPQSDPLKGVLEAMIAGPVDPDYLSGWPVGTRVLSATTQGTVTTVDLSAEARTTTLAPEATLAHADQLIWTVTELVGADTAVRLTIDGQPVGDLWGAGGWAEPRPREDAFGARVLVSIDTPSDGATVASPVVVTGDAAAHEATLPWRVLDGAGAVVEEGVVKTAEGMTFAPYTIEVTLPPGTYTIEVREDDLGPGEGHKPDVDTRKVTVAG